MWPVVLALTALSSSPGRSSSAVQPPPGTVGCYRADRPLGTSAGSIRGRAVPGYVGHQIGEDSAGLTRLTTFHLLDSGRVARPGTFGASWWARGSQWQRVGDTLRVRLSTVTAGWVLRLVAAPAGRDSSFVGVARYLTDVIVRDTSAWRPPQDTVRVRREPCTVIAPGRAGDRGARR